MLSKTLMRQFTKCGSLWKPSRRCKATKTDLKGLAVAPVSPFDSNGQLDSSVMRRCVQYFKDTKFDGMFVNGTLGEGMSLSLGERKLSAEKWMEAADESLYIILHIGTGNLGDTQDLARHAQDIGVDAIAALPPTYHKPTTEEQLVAYLEQVAMAAPDTPLLYYEYNITTGVYLNIPRTLQLAESRVPTLYGLKHTSPELNSALNCATVCGGKYKVFFGTESLYLPTLSLGIPDVITLPYLGKMFFDIREEFEKGNSSKATEIQKQVLNLTNIWTKHGGGIACAKAMFQLLSGIPVGSPRLPLFDLTPEKKVLLQADLKQQGFLH